MQRRELDGFRVALLRSGVAPRNVRRAAMELGDHYQDLFEAARVSGVDAAEADRQARARLGDLDSIAAEIAARPELQSWAWKHPRLAVLFYPLACAAVLPAVPLIAGVAHAPALARWIGCAILSGLVTATMLLLMQLVITLS